MRSLSALIGFSLAAAAFAQPCEPAWEAVIGTPGVTSDGYIAPMHVYDAGAGERLFAGGSFTSVGGYFTRGIAQWNPGTGEWGAVGGGCYSQFTNSFLTALATLDFGDGPELVAAGFFDTAGGQANTSHLARWNGSRWAGIPGGQPNFAVWGMGTFLDQLVIGGSFASVGGVAANGIARWDAEAGWQPMGSGIGGGFSPNVFALRTFNDGSGDKLYAGGRFASLGGVSGLIARWTGTAWQPVGGGIAQANGNTFAGIECMAVFNDGNGEALYVGGYDLLPWQSPLCSIAKWDGVRWRAVGQYLGGRTTSLAVFDDGTGPALYAGGTAQPGISYVARLEGTQWVTLSGGVGQPGGPPWPSVFGLLAWHDRLYVGGDFDYVGQGQLSASGIAAWRGCAPACDPDINCDGSPDQGDVACIILAVAGDLTCICRDPDFNADGSADQGDVAAIIGVVAGQPCP